MTIDTSVVNAQNLWEVIESRQGTVFYTKKGLPFTYQVRGGELFTDRRERSITLSTFEKAYEKLIEDRVGDEAPCRVTGPKSLNMYGAPYVWAVFMGIGFIKEDQLELKL